MLSNSIVLASPCIADMFQCSNIKILGFSNILLVAFLALNQVNTVLCFTCMMSGDFNRFSGEVRFELSSFFDVWTDETSSSSVAFVHSRKDPFGSGGRWG